MTTLGTSNAEHVIQYEFVDQGQNVWIVPAEILPTKFKDAFLLHKSIGLDNDTWTVTHADSGISFVTSPTKAEAIEGLDLSAVDDRGFVALLASVGVVLGGPRGTGMSAVNTVLDALAPATREALLLRFLSALHSPHADG